MEETSDILKILLEHTESLELKENIYLNTVNILKKCFEENERLKKIKPPIIKECDVKILLQNCLDKSECIIKIHKIERIFTNEHGSHYHNIYYNINNGSEKISKITAMEGFCIFSEKYCKIYKPKTIRFESEDVKITYRIDDTLKHILDESLYHIKYKTFDFDEDDTEESREYFNHYDFYRKTFEWIHSFLCCVEI